MAMSLSPSTGSSSGDLEPFRQDPKVLSERFGPRPITADFQALHRQCRENGQFYEDPDFPAENTSLYFSRQPPFKIKWMRPSEIAGQYGLRPELFRDGVMTFDLIRGELGDNQVVAAAASLSENLDLLYQTIPDGQGFFRSWYAGLFLFRFWRHGTWEEVIIDDRLPTLQGRLVFVHSRAPNEFWGALLEKAYAKFYGSYEALKAGFVTDALHDFTAGLVESYKIHGDPPPPSNIINILFKALEKQTLISASTSEVDPSHVDDHGLFMGHTYTISDMREIRLISDGQESILTLIRLRNPWGTKVPWNGPFSEGSYEWNSIPDEDRASMGLVFRDHAEFWMNFNDFVALFSTIELCNLPPDAPLETPHLWSVFSFKGRWKRGVNAGGRPICKETHWCNPQYKVSLRSSDEDENGKCSFLVEVLQRERLYVNYKAPARVDIGFVVYSCYLDYRLPLPAAYFDHHTFVERCDFYTNSRQVTKRFLLEPGDYIVIPTTYEADTEADYHLRVFCEQQNTAEFVDDHASVLDPSLTMSDPLVQERKETFQHFFSDLAGESLEIDIHQFHKIINMGLRNDLNQAEISLEACRTMMSLVDRDHRSRLGYFDFLYLWNCIISWKKMFYQYQENNNGVISAYALRTVMASQGYRVTSGVLERMVFRYADDQYQISFDNFIACMAKLLSLMNTFKCNESADGKAVFTLEKWLECTLLL